MLRSEVKILLKKILFNRYTFIMFILLAGYYLVGDNINKTISESRPDTDNFLMLLSKNKKNRLYDKYALESRMGIDAFSKKIDMFHQVFGKIKSYKYDGNNATYKKNSRFLTGIYIYYIIFFEDEKKCQATFSIEIDRITNKPVPGRIETFEILGRNVDEYFFIRLPAL